eukprot:gene2119-5159_t
MVDMYSTKYTFRTQTLQGNSCALTTERRRQHHNEPSSEILHSSAPVYQPAVPQLLVPQLLVPQLQTVYSCCSLPTVSTASAAIH